MWWCIGGVVILLVAYTVYLYGEHAVQLIAQSEG